MKNKASNSSWQPLRSSSKISVNNENQFSLQDQDRLSKKISIYK